MNINDAFPSKYLKAGDLKGQAHILTIDRCVMEDVGGQGSSEHKPVLYFRGTEKGVVLNKTNGGVVSYLYGPETEAWAGKQIEVYPDTVLFNNQMVPCIRLRQHVPAAGALAQPMPAAPAAATPPQPAQDQNFDERNPPPLEGDLDDSVPF